MEDPTGEALDTPHADPQPEVTPANAAGLGHRCARPIRRSPMTWPPSVWGALSGLAVAIVVCGPGLRRGAWINIDHTLLPSTAAPNSLWGVGVELPRRAPFTTFAALGADAHISDVLAKVVVLALFAAAGAGVVRLAAFWGELTGSRSTDRLLAVGAAVLYVTSPLVLTRLSVGHIGWLWALGLVPHALCTWLDPERPVAASFLWAAAVGLGGHLAGGAALLCLPVVLAALGPRRSAPRFLAIMAGQLVWVMPGWAIQRATSFGQPGGVDFPTRVSWPWAPLRLVVGQGFFQTQARVDTPDGAIGLTIAAVVLVAAAGGWWALRPRRRVWAVLAAVAPGTALALVSTTPSGLRWWSSMSSTLPLNLWREGQRAFLVPWLFLCVGVVWGISALVRRWPLVEWSIAAVPVVLAASLVAPNLWGIHGVLNAEPIPQGWIESRDAIARDPGTLLVLPPEEYSVVSWAGSRRSHMLFPSFVGGDAIVSTDAGSPNGGSQADMRMDRVLSAVLRAGFDHTVLLGELLRPIGVKWVALLQAPGNEIYSDLSADPNLERVIVKPRLQLFRVRDAAVAVGPDGALDAEEVWPGLVLVHSNDAVTVSRSGSGGWMRGTVSGSPTTRGTVTFGPGSQWVWYWPAAITQATYLLIALCVGLSVHSVASRRRRVASDESPST